MNASVVDRGLCSLSWLVVALERLAVGGTGSVGFGIVAFVWDDVERKARYGALRLPYL